MEKLAGRVAANVRYLMGESGLNTQVKLSTAAGVSQAYLSTLLKGQQSPTTLVLDKLADALGVDPWQLLLPEALIKKGIRADVTRLMIYAADSGPDGIDVILRVAEAQAKTAS